MLKPADAQGLNIRLFAVTVLLALLAAAAALSPAGSSYRGTQAALGAAALALFIATAATGMRIDRSPAHAALAVFILAGLAAAAVSVWPVGSLIEVGLVSIYLVVFVLAANLGDRSRLRAAAHLLVFVGATVAVFGLYQYFIGNAADLSRLKAAGHVVQVRQLTNMMDRAFANFPSANSFAGFLVLFLLLGVGLFLYERDLRWRLWLGLNLAVMSAALYYTGSKGGWLALAGGLAVIYIGGQTQNDKRRRAIAYSLLGGAALVAVIGAAFGFNPAAVAANTGGRLELWGAAGRIILAHPIFGIGPGAFGTALTLVQSGRVYSPYAHNSYVQMGAETGLIGLAAWLAALAYLVIVAGRALGGSGAERAVRLGLLAAIVGFLVHNAVDYTWYIPGVALSFWFMAGLAVAPSDRQPTGGSQPGVGRYLLILVLTVALIPVLLVYTAESRLSAAGLFKDGFELKKAAAAYKRSLRLFPFSAEAHDGLAQTLYLQALVDRQKTAAEAAAHERLAIRLRPTWPFYHSRLADSLSLSGRDQAAIKEYRRAVSLYPLEPKLRVKAGNYFLAKQRYREALELFKSAAALGKVYLEESHSASEIVSARPDVSEPLISIGMARIGIARSYIELREYKAAAAAVDKAERLAGSDPGILYLRGRIKEGSGSYAGAEGFYRRALAEMPAKNPEILYRLALCLERQGKRRSAVFEVRKALKAAPDFRPAKALLKKIGPS